jgi:hypothetical protein
MAKSPTHKFGQIIGDVLESTIEEILSDFIRSLKGYYLDKKGPRKIRGRKSKVTWIDAHGNSHDLDFVIEKGGTDDETGNPVAFIECAWRRYTRHSRNKAQEVQGAIIPLAEAYKENCPFLGIILAGDFTQGSITQLQSLGFNTLYFDYDTIKKAFNSGDIDAHFDEDTPDSVAQKKVDAFILLTAEQVQNIKTKLKKLKKIEINIFMQKLQRSILRKIEIIRIIILHGTEYKANTLDDAIEYIAKYQNDKNGIELYKIEIYIRYNNGDKIDANFQDKENAIAFLKNYRYCE